MSLSDEELDASVFGPLDGALDAGMPEGLLPDPAWAAPLLSLDVEEEYVQKGKNILKKVLSLCEKHDISDIHFQPDRFVYIATAEGLVMVEEIEERLRGKDVVGILLALIYMRESGTSGDVKLQEQERQMLERALSKERCYNFSCAGGLAEILEGEGATTALTRGRFRVQAHFSAAGLGITCRILKEKITTLEQTGLPKDIIAAMTQAIRRKSGLCIVSGSTGSGKTTTLAALIEWVRVNLNKHVVTIEDPIEYHYEDTMRRSGEDVPANSLITQQEVGRDVHSYQQGLEDALRKRPDIILLGEIRDATTMATCLEAAQTGHLILTTLHTRGAIRTMSRILEFFPQNQSEAIMSSLSETLVFVLSQGLLPPDSGNTDQGRVLCAEFLQINTTAAKNSIRKYKAGESNLENIMNGTCNVRWNDSLTKLRADRKISEETLAEHKNDTPAADMTKSSKV